MYVRQIFFSDHCEVKFSLSEIIAPDELQGNILNFEDLNVGSKYIWNKTLQDEYVTKLSAPETVESFEYVFKDINDGTSNNQMDECVNNFVLVLDGVCKPLLERKVLLNQDNYSKKQYDEGCEMYKELFLEKLNKYRKNKTDANKIELVEARSAYKKSVRTFKYDCLKNKTQYLLQQKHKDAKQYWKLLKESQGITSPKSLTSRHFLEYFKSVNNPNDHFYQADEDILQFNERVLSNENETMFGELDQSITDAEIRRGIKELKTGKSGGPDKIINEFLIHGASTLLPYLNILFNLVFNQGYFPVCWSEGYIVPIHKKGNLNNVENYRGITYLSVL